MITATLILVLSGWSLATVGKARTEAQAVQCVQHLRQLHLGWQIYVDEHGGVLPGNAATGTGGVWRGVVDSWAGESSAPYDDDTRRLEDGQLWRSGALTSANVFRCPADRSRPVSGRGLRTRSYSLNGNLGGRTNEVQTRVGFQGEIVQPSAVMAFIDEHEESIDDGHFLVWAAPDDRWVNLPADRHGGLGVWSAVDGHIEKRRWAARKEFLREGEYWMRARPGGDLADLRALQTWVLPVPREPPTL
ncbi:MAG: hypothetical protein JNK85_25140 [Verrucomicrobiales bacterium]|nr:hypothetical protein [Verrucomicrobiales bacterium]